jgi:hypothetical protein
MQLAIRSVLGHTGKNFLSFKAAKALFENFKTQSQSLICAV